MQRRLGIWLVIGLLVQPAIVLASGGSSMPPPMTPSSGSNNPPPMPTKSPAEQAAEQYNTGIQHRDKAVALQKEAAAAPEKDRAKLEKKADKEFEKAINSYRQSTQLNNQMFQAYSDLGFCLRKTGNYPLALEAYNRALSLAPAYAPAIEYRAEAYLGLDQVDDAKKAYMDLFSTDRSHADELMVAMKGWVQKRQSDPGKMTPETVQSFSTWVQEREELAKQTPSVSEMQTRKW